MFVKIEAVFTFLCEVPTSCTLNWYSNVFNMLKNVCVSSRACATETGSERIILDANSYNSID